jgi:hypothetical protein
MLVPEMQAAAIKNNEKMFPVFEKKLSTAKEDLLCGTTSKLSMWLNSEKAYYAEARPKVSFPLTSIDCSDELDMCFR